MSLSTRQIVRKFIGMGLSQSALGSWAGRLPFVRDLQKRLVWAKQMNAFQGAFATYDAAQASVAAFTKTGWNHQEIADLMRSAEITPNGTAATLPPLDQPSTYALMFWLASLIKPGTRIVDLGGAKGVTYYAYGDRMGCLPRDAHWTVIEVPLVAEEGQRLATERKAGQLSFGSDLATAGPCDILVSAGCIQYMPQAVPGLLETMRHKPRHILLNKVALRDGDSMWTVQNIANSGAPYRIFNRTELVSYFKNAGYVLRDSWHVPEIFVLVPFHPECAVEKGMGFYFERQDG